MKTLSCHSTSWRVGLVFCCAGLLSTFGHSAFATTYNVATTSDFPITTVNATTGAISSGPNSGQITLRSAVIAANSNGVGPHTINVPAGTYNLSQTNPNSVGSTATAGLNDLQIGSHGSTITVIGTGATPRIVQTISGNDVITTGFKSTGAPAVVNLTLNNLEITGGTYTGIFLGADDGSTRSVTTITNCNIHDNNIADPSFGQGGAIQHLAGSLSISGTTFANNAAKNSSVGQGGAIYFNLPNASGTGSIGSLTITNCVFTGNNSAIGNTYPGGGAIFIAVASNDGAGGAINVTGCTFSGNLVGGGGDGGAIAVLNTGGRTLNLLRNFFTGNQATNANGHGGAIAVHSGLTNINYNRFFNNTAATVANGRAIYHRPGNADTVNANDNWWGVNTGPATNDVTGAAVSLTTWLQLRNIASPAAVSTGPPVTSTLVTADILGRNSGGPIAASNLNGLPPFPITFSNPQRGMLSGASSQLVNGQASVTFTPANPGGVGGVDATADSQTVTAMIIVNQAPTITSANSTIFTIGTNGNFQLSATGYPASFSYSNIGASLPTGVTLSSSGVLSGTPGAGTGGTYNLTFQASNGVTPNGTQSFTLTVRTIAEAWRQQYFSTTQNTGNAADTADPDGDNLINLQERAFGTDPTTRQFNPVSYVGNVITAGRPTTLVTYAQGAPQFSAMYSRRKDYILAGLTYTVQFSSDLVTWNDSAVVPTVVADDNSLQVVTVPYPASVRKQFFRVVVTQQ